MTTPMDDQSRDGLLEPVAWRWRYLYLAVGIAFAVAACGPQLRDRPTHQEAQSERDEIVGYMVRLGYDKWVAACAYHFGKRHLPREEMFKACMADFTASGIEARQGGDVKQAPIACDESAPGRPKNTASQGLRS